MYKQRVAHIEGNGGPEKGRDFGESTSHSMSRSPAP